MNPEVVCSWPVGRVFNALLAATREHLPADPIVTAMASLKAADKSSTVTTAQFGTVRALVGQLIVALPDDEPARPQPRKTQPPLVRSE
jgi:hypothetical protein